MCMETGKRRRVMIACVTFETFKVFNPIKYYETSIVHIIHYIRDTNSHSTEPYSLFYNHVCEMIKEYNPESQIIEHSVDVSDFQKMLRTVDSIIKEEYRYHPNSDIFINISAGTSEYVAAATISSMMFTDTIPFAVKTKKYTVYGEDAIKNAYFKNNLPVGMTEETYDPAIISKITIERPNDDLVRGLKILRDVYDKKPGARASEIIDCLKNEGVWFRNPSNAVKTDENRYNLVCYHRDFVDRWVKLGWVVKDDYRHRYFVTQEGDRIISTFYK